MHQPSYDLCKIFVDDYLLNHKTLRACEVGSFDVNGTYKPLFARDDWEYVGFDVVLGPNVDHIFPPQTNEHDESFDVVISGQCLEHVRKPWEWIKQVAKLVKSGGLVWVIAPNTFHYHAQDHYPDCWRIWPDGLRALFDEAELETVYSRMVGIDTFGLARKK